MTDVSDVVHMTEGCDCCSSLEQHTCQTATQAVARADDLSWNLALCMSGDTSSTEEFVIGVFMHTYLYMCVGNASARIRMPRTSGVGKVGADIERGVNSSGR